MPSPTAKKQQLTTAAQTLYQRLNGIASGFRSVAVAVVADAGMGKTHTVQQTLAAIPCTKVFVPMSEAWHWLPLRFLNTKKTVPEWAKQVFKQLQARQVPPEKTIAQAIVAHLTALAPVVVHLEDAHEASTNQLGVWTEVAQMHSKNKGIGLVLTSRILVPAIFVEYRLESLSLEQTQELLQEQTPLPLPTEALHWLYTQSQGNPLFALEYYQHVLRQGMLWQQNKTWVWEAPKARVKIPLDLEALIIERLEILLEQSSQAENLKKVLLKLAFLPEQPDLQEKFFLSWSSVEQDTYNLELLQTGIWLDTQFVHPLYPEVLRSRIWKKERTQVARELLEILLELAPESMERLIQAADLEALIELKWWKQVAVTAQLHGFQQLHGQALARAIIFVPTHEKAALAHQTGNLLRPFNQVEWTRLSEMAFGLEPDHPVYIRDRILTLLTAKKWDEAQQLLGQSTQWINSSALWLSAALQVYSFSGKFEQTIAIWNSCPEFHDKINPGVIWTVSWAYTQLGQSEQANQVVDKLLNRSITLEAKLFLYNVKGLGLRQAGMYQQAFDTFSQAMALVSAEDAARQSMFSPLAIITLNHGLNLQDMGRQREAILNIQQSLVLTKKLNNLAEIPLGQAGLAASMYSIGEFIPAERLLLEALEYLQFTNDWRLLQSVHTFLAEMYMDWQPSLAGILAIKHAREGLRYLNLFASEFEMMSSFIPIAWVEAVHGDASTALTLIEKQLSIAEQHKSELHLARGQFLKGRVLFALKQTQSAKIMMQQALKMLEPIETKITLERWFLEYNHVFQELNSVQFQIQRLNAFGDSAKSVFHVVQRYFPQFFATTPFISQTIQLEVLGEMRLSGIPIPKRQGKARELLIMLLEARLLGRNMVSQLDLMDRLYTNEPEEQAATAIRQLVFRVRKSFGTAVIVHSPLGYGLGVGSDAEVFLETSDTTLWRGVYLFAEKTHSGVQEALLTALSRAVKHQNPTEAVRVSQILLDSDPYNPDVLRIYINALARANETLVAASYAVQRQRFVAIAETLPETWQEFLEQVPFVTQ